ncbi:DUF2189 domain-containing protein [Lentibacter sp. XHP0401]|uniref:DUF2189 domain-containing protein n=1 Tax=Lentibacter sp. XHP0401 TaxID=2984334 RepID=UPI0021E79CBC|nr:DUF2189 domain-containing protein [Lentibacter sp. XHP0401]MCV2891778.1 DUF2189 domain-containing protein [Lentibacter sp. XHP0401]
MITKEQGAPELGAVTFSDMKSALCKGWADMRHAPVYGLVVASICVAFGLLLFWVTSTTGKSYWLVFAAVGFPLFGPFTAVALYEVSHRIDYGEPLVFSDIFGIVLHQARRQLPSLCAIILMVFLFWFFIAHMIFALFLGLSTMTNVSSSLEVYLSSDGLTMLAVGTIIGALFALLLFMITVFAMPMLLDREIDFVTAMITSFAAVQNNLIPMVFWGILIAGLTFLGMVPAFLGLYIVLPLLGHASWHLYRAAEARAEA